MKKWVKQLLIVLIIFAVAAGIIFTTNIYFNANSVRSTFGSYQITDTGDRLIPGEGWNGENTTQPATIGNPSDFGYDARAIAHWDVVPYQTFNDAFNVGVLAFHTNDIDNVSFSVNNGSWIAVHNMTENPQTGVVEYWATLNASDFSDSTIEVRAIAYPKIGIPRVLQGTTIMNENSSLILNANSQGTLPHRVRYVSTIGSDNNDCLTELTACRTIASAINKSSSAGLGSSVDGSEIKLGEGNWQLPVIVGDPWWTRSYTDSTQWVTITSAQSANPNNVQITGMDTVSCPNGNTCGGMGFAHLHLYNLSVVGHIGSSPGAGAGSYLWFDHVFIHHLDPSILCIDMVPIPGWGSAGIWQGVYYTDVHMNNTDNGPGGIISRNVYAEFTGGAHASGTATLINYSVQSSFGGWYTMPNGCQTGDIHGDIYQMGYARNGDVIMYGVNIIPGGVLRSTRGIVVGGNDVALVNVDLSNYGGYWGFSSCGGQDAANNPFYVDHFVIKNSVFKGGGDWCGESPGSVANISMFSNTLIKNSVFDNGNPLQVPYPWNSSGIRYVDMQAMYSAGIVDNGSCPLNYVANLSQYNITWYFDKCYRAGQFVNGDWWVVGAVNITNINPVPNCSQGRNGAMVNPHFNSSHGYDSRAPGYSISDCHEGNIILQPGDSIVSSASSTVGHGKNDESYLDAYAVLTVVDSPQDEGTFRPPYTRPIRVPISSQDTLLFSLNSFNWSVLPKLPLISGTPNINSSANSLAQHPIEHFAGWQAYHLDTKLAPQTYGRELSTAVSELSLQLLLNYSNNEKRETAVNLLQYGIDLYGIYLDNGEWESDGGIFCGRKWPILFTGIMLNNEMKNIGNSTMIFHEDGQTFYVGEDDIYSLPYELNSWNSWQYGDSGYAKVTHGSAFVEGINTNWTNPMKAANTTDQSVSGFWWFGIANDSEAYSAISRAYTIKGVYNETRMELNEEYRGETNSNAFFKTGNWLIWYGHGNAGKELDYEEYTQEHYGLPEWGIEHDDEPDADGLDWDAPYRTCCNANSWAGFILAALALEENAQTKKLWNHTVLFDYQDRYMDIELTNGNLNSWTRQMQDFGEDMWDSYRSDYGCVWTRNNNAENFSNGYYNCFGEDLMCADRVGSCSSGNCHIVSVCSDYQTQRALNYDPCDLGCIVYIPQANNEDGGNGGSGGGGGGGAAPIKNSANTTLDDNLNNADLENENNPEVNISTKDEEKGNMAEAFNKAVKLIGVIAGLVVIIGAIWFGVYKLFSGSRQIIKG